jgi:DNA-binding transcriptional LysR family regulator
MGFPKVHKSRVFDWNDLRYFLAVARNGSTLAAGKALGVSQSTIHRRIVALESAISQPVVKRLATGYRLTEFGKTLLPDAERMESAAAAVARRAAAADTALDGIIRLTCASTVANRLVRSAVLRRFHAKHPRLRVEIAMADRFLDLTKGEADVALRGGESTDPALIGRKVAEVPWAIYGSRDYIAQHGRPARPQDIDAHAIIGFAGEIANHQAAKWLRAAAPRATIAARGNNIPSVLMAVKSGAGLAPLPAPLADCEPDLVQVLATTSQLRLPLYLMVHPDLRRTPRIKAFFDFFNSEIGVLQPILTGARPKTDEPTSSRPNSRLRGQRVTPSNG